MSEILRRIGDDYIDYDGEDTAIIEDSRYRMMQEELAAFDKLSEEEACLIYNVDYKEEARQYIIDYWS